jgi:cytochrome c peroxidase
MNRASFKSLPRYVLFAVLSAAATGCVGGRDGDGYVWTLPEHFPAPSVPADNPMSTEKVELGRHLFYDRRLSADESMSCATCHEQRLAFTDAQRVSQGITGQSTPRSSMSLANVAYSSTLTWANPLLGRLENQAMVPMFGEDPVELGLAGKETVFLDKLRADPRYVRMFAAAYPDDAEPFAVERVVQALAAFERTLISADSAYDRFLAGDDEAMSESALRGMELFFSERLECFHCHGGFNFSDAVDHEGLPVPESAFHNTGLYNLDGNGAYPDGNTGVREISEDDADMGRFKAPTLRNIAVTAPYMHDGSIDDLDGVLRHYAMGGRRIESGPYAGEGFASPLKSQFVPGFVLDDGERRDVLAFLDSLTDEAFLTNPRFADPWLP